MSEIDELIAEACDIYKSENRGIEPSESTRDMIRWLIRRKAENEGIDAIRGYVRSASLWIDLIEKRERDGEQ